MDSKNTFSERDIITKFILPAIEKSGWISRVRFVRKLPLQPGEFL